MTGETAHRSTAATKEVNGPGIIWHIPRPTRNEETVPEQIEQPTFTPRPVLSFVRRSGRLDARLQRAWDNYADTYLLDINAGEGSLDVRDDFILRDGTCVPVRVKERRKMHEAYYRYFTDAFSVG